MFLKAICRIGSAHVISVSESDITLKSFSEVFTNTFIKKFTMSYLQDVCSVTLVNGCDTHPIMHSEVFPPSFPREPQLILKFVFLIKSKISLRCSSRLQCLSSLSSCKCILSASHLPGHLFLLLSGLPCHRCSLLYSPPRLLNSAAPDCWIHFNNFILCGKELLLFITFIKFIEFIKFLFLIFL